MVMSGAKRLRRGSLILCLLLAGAALPLTPAPVLALSELQQIPGETAGNPDAGSKTAPPDASSDPLQLPMPDPLIRREEGSAQQPVEDAPDAEGDDADQPQTPVEVLYDIEKAPEPVRRMRQLIVEAAASGDIQRLEPLLGKGLTETQVSGVETNESPVDTLKGLSGDPEGIEILAILLDVLATGFVHVGEGTPDDLYVWPYFAEKPLASLTPPEKVELLRIVTAGDVADMQELGAYNFYRVGITPDGQWKFFFAGD
ncbi:hypothetical protein KYK29_12455 [Shinella daejeonensis]|uniref:hypothetical protein n=1 Tax=Shinella daejeonensis TaxID=659017 RepID=UPI0020C7C200|nr:hypothetical protein [Shinella daejeonensis]MCP8895734.1 hypothetical protein [Shinella daejeonensis]